MRRVKRGIVRRSMAALALLAASLLLLQPVCRAYERLAAVPHGLALHADGHDAAKTSGAERAPHGGAPCCAQSTPDAWAGPCASLHESIPPVAAPSGPTMPELAFMARARAPERVAWAAPPPPSYYARSARILR